MIAKADLTGIVSGQLRRVRQGGFTGNILRVSQVYESPASGTQVVLQTRIGDEWVDFCRASAAEVLDLTEASNQPLTEKQKGEMKAKLWERAIAAVQTAAQDEAFRKEWADRFGTEDWAVQSMLETLTGEITSALWPRAFPG